MVVLSLVVPIKYVSRAGGYISGPATLQPPRSNTQVPRNRRGSKANDAGAWSAARGQWCCAFYVPRQKGT